MRLTLLPACLILALLIPGLATANEARQQMLELSNEAAAAVERGDHRIGAAQFRLAYEIYPDPILLNNELVAWYRSGDCPAALNAAEAVLSTDELDDDDKVNARAVDISCHLQMAQKAIDDDQGALARDFLHHLSDRDLDEDDRQTYDELVAASDDLDPAGPDPHSSSARAAWLQIVGGVAITGVGLGMHSVALDRQSQLEDLSNTAGQQQLFETRRDDWASSQSRARWMVPTLYGVGALAIGSGIYFLRRDTSLPQLFGLQPTFGEDQLGMTLRRSF